MKTLPTLVSIFLSFLLVAKTNAGGTWEDLASMPAPRQEMATAALNGKIYVLAGYDNKGMSTDSVFVCNPSTNTWVTAHPLPRVNNHNSAAVAAGKLYSFGGLSNATHVYDPVNDSWTLIAFMHTSHSATAAVGVFNDKIYVAGGVEGTAVEVYDPAANTWTTLASMHVPRNHCGGGVINGKFYVVGGRGSAQAPTALEVYDPATNSWSSRAPMPTGRSGIATAVVNGELYVFGGEIPALHGEVEVYNPNTNTWRSLPPMPLPRHGIWASVIGNRIFLPGGGVEVNIGPTEVGDVFVVNTKAVFANISTRLKVESGENALIGGFIVTGVAPKRMILRAIGPSLSISGALSDPRLELYDSAGQLLATNDNWRDAPNAQEITDSAIAPTSDYESAILTTVSPGAYTAVVRGVGQATGIGLVEAYDLEAGSDSQLANISTRGLVQTENNVLIGGLILTGQQSRRMIVRAIGPSLNLSGRLGDPTLELRDGSGTLLASNDNWRTTQETEIIGTGIPPANDLESAIVQTLVPGSYTAIVSGLNNTTGIAVVEAYALD
jgi:N-acetylneuraminic acid mutarotase